MTTDIVISKNIDNYFCKINNPADQIPLLHFHTEITQFLMLLV